MTYYTDLQRLCDAQTARLAAQQDEIGMLRAILAGRTQERDAARAALHKYGFHAAGCEQTVHDWCGCTCGLRAALEGSEG